MTHSPYGSPFPNPYGINNSSKPFPNEEPNQMSRELAKSLRQMFVALVQENFTEEQAMYVIGVTMASAIQSNNKKDE